MNIAKYFQLTGEGAKLTGGYLTFGCIILRSPAALSHSTPFIQTSNPQGWYSPHSVAATKC